jgi:type I restriction enzyme S subunit
MMWSTLTIDEIKANSKYACVGGPFGSELTRRDYVDEGVPVIRGSNLPDGAEFYDDGFVFVSEQKAEDLVANTAQPGDLVFTQRGTLGQVGLIPADAKYKTYVVSQSQMKLTIDSEKANSRYVYYYFCQRQIVELIKSRAITSGVPHINLGILKGLTITLPSVAEQERVVGFLDAYSGAIANNLRRIELLEQSARLLFKEWFVYLRYPGHEHDNIKNGVPEGWKRQQLSEVLTLHYGKALQEEKREPGDICVYGSSGNVGRHNVKLVDGPGIVVGRKGNVGSVFWVDESFWPIDTVYYVEPMNVSLFVLHLLQAQTFQNSDAAVPGLNRDYAYSTKILWPKQALRDDFEEVVNSMFEQRRTLLAATSKLEAALELLLSRLMVGRLSV